MATTKARPAGLAVAAALLIAAGAAAAAALATHGAATTRRVSVTESEYRITLKPRSLAAGMTMFVVHNKGKIAHAFEIRGPGVSGNRIAGAIAPGATKSLSVRLEKGRYTLFCPIHVAAGMKTTVAVGSVMAGGTTTNSTTTSKSSWG